MWCWSVCLCVIEWWAKVQGDTGVLNWVSVFISQGELTHRHMLTALCCFKGKPGANTPAHTHTHTGSVQACKHTQSFLSSYMQDFGLFLQRRKYFSVGMGRVGAFFVFFFFFASVCVYVWVRGEVFTRLEFKPSQRKVISHQRAELSSKESEVSALVKLLLWWPPFLVFTSAWPNSIRNAALRQKKHAQMNKKQIKHTRSVCRLFSVGQANNEVNRSSIKTAPTERYRNRKVISENNFLLKTLSCIQYQVIRLLESYECRLISFIHNRWSCGKDFHTQSFSFRLNQTVTQNNNDLVECWGCLLTGSH